MASFMIKLNPAPMLTLPAKNVIAPVPPIVWLARALLNVVVPAVGVLKVPLFVKLPPKVMLPVVVVQVAPALMIAFPLTTIFLLLISSVPVFTVRRPLMVCVLFISVTVPPAGSQYTLLNVVAPLMVGLVEAPPKLTVPV